jgi:oligosaccharyl transferase (archaeosortase A-associated)
MLDLSGDAIMSALFIEKNKYKILTGILLLALAVRLWVFPVVFSGGNITILGADSYYHIRRIFAAVAHFPSVLSFDSYIDFPYGSKITWAPLYDMFIAAVALLIGAGSPSIHTIEVTAALIPLLLGVLTVWLVFAITEKIFDWRAGLISAGIFAITPSHVYVSFLGYTDHHVAETLLSTAAYLCFIIAIKRMRQNNITFGNFRANLLKNLLFPVITGILLALSIFTWDGAPIFIGLIGLYIPVQFVIDRKFGRSSAYLLLTGGITFLVSILIILPVAVSGGTGFEIISYLPTMFHVAFLSVFFFLCVLLFAMQKLQFKKWWHNPLLLLLIFGTGVFSLKIFALQFYLSATDGIGYLLGGGVLSTIQEAVPLFNTPSGGFTLTNVWNAFSFSFYIALLALIYFIYKTRREKYPPEAVFLITWSLIILVLTVLQRRFIYLFAVNNAIFTAYFIVGVLKPFEGKKNVAVSRKRRKGQRETGSASSVILNISLILLFLIAISNIFVIKSFASGTVGAPDPDFRDSYMWLKDNSQPTSYYDAPDKTPEYGVMSWWDSGNWILFIARRPVVANNFQTGIDDAARFFTEPDEKTANEILGKRNVRYIITDAQMLKLKFKSIALMAGKRPEDYYEIKTVSDVGEIRSVNNENKKFFDTMLSKLHVFDGNGLGHYRLILESSTTAIKSPDIKYVKIFEYVPGATISGRAADGEVKATLNIVTNQGRTLVDTWKTTSSNGRYEIKVPYPTLDGKYGTGASGDYVIQNGNISTKVSVSEQDVQEGREIKVDLV